MNRNILFLVIGIVALVLVACGGAPASEEFTIEMTEFAYAPEAIEVSVGQEVTLKISNHGALAHEVMIGRDVVMEDGRPATYAHNMFEDVEPMVMAAEEHQEDTAHEEDDEHVEDADDHEEGDDHEAEDTHSEDEDGHSGDDHGFMVNVPAGDADQSTSITFTVTEDMVGEWEIGCFLDEGTHYTAGMVGTFVVKP